MYHPVLRDYRSRILYVMIWIIVIIVHIAYLTLKGNLPFGMALADSLIFNIVLAILIIPLWYPVYYYPWNKRRWYFTIAFHLILLSLLLFIWFSLGNLISWLFLGGNESYDNFFTIVPLWRVVEGALIYIVIMLIYYQYVYIEKLNEKVNNEIYLMRLIKDGELNLLKSQINPHFLFNGLNSVNSLIIKDSVKAQEMLVALSDYLRYTVLSHKKEASLLQEELENVERYLSIEKLRFGDKLNYEFKLEDACLSFKIPPMLLQPLFENAVKHGVYESMENVCIYLKCRVDSGFLFLEISNDFDPDGFSQKKGSGTGLKNVKERLRLFYGKEASLLINTEDKVYTITLKMPLDLDE